MKNIALLLLAAAAASAPAFGQAASAGDTMRHGVPVPIHTEESLFLNMQKIGLGALDDTEEKKKFLDTVQLEKEKIQYRMLQNVYENAYLLYRSGDYDSARDLAARILSIDPNFQDASMILEASTQLKGSARPMLSERVMIEDRFKESLSFYQEGRIVEAHRKMEEVAKLAPNNIKARYWLGRMKDNLKDYYVSKGEEAYVKRDLKSALDNYYNALLIKPREAAIIDRIARVEDELRRERATDSLKSALEAYAQGNLKGAYDGLRRVLEIQPGDAKAGKLLGDVKGEIEQGFIARGRQLYGSRKYTEAISEWDKAKPYASNPKYLAQLVSRAKQQMKLEEEARKRRAEESARKAREEEELRAREEEERRKAEEEAKRKGVASGPVEKKPQGVSEENRQSAQRHYMEGIKHFQSANYDKARDEWTIAKQLDPGNADADAGLKRIEQLLSGGR
ncbi:MAG: Tetratricopeptide domain-containing protein [Elusimicrobia bacterium]|nr:MAG: Tetratricopeptide domain-containing protein [Elusimicrobiota bacterium]KAF0157827.1 MAG: Tetratricopeptide domain-containing protein [Elusimicrobiota bacterium]